MKDKLVVDYRPIDSVTPYAFNARKHSKKQVTQVGGSILEFGFVVPILIDENDTVMAGHCRLEAAKELGMTVIPVILRVFRNDLPVLTGPVVYTPIINKQKGLYNYQENEKSRH